MSQTKKIAVIGGGIAGVLSVAMLKEEKLEPVCFEKSGTYGGTWCYREEVDDGVASIMPTTIINHSKELGAFSNFPPKKEFNNYMRHNQLLEYITQYMKHNDVERHIQCNMEVTSVSKSEDYDDTGKWIVTAKNTLTDEIKTEKFDGVMVCVGHINRPKMANFPGQENFKGRILHTHSLKGVDSFKDKKVVIIGMGCSALDAAVELSSVTKQVYISTRCGAYIINRLGPNGYPIDYVLFRRYLVFFLDVLPSNLCSWYVETFYLDQHFDHRLYTVPPKYHMLSKDPILNDHIASKFMSGAVVQKGDVEKFTENGVIFHGDENVTEADVVIMATGYTYEFPFLEDDVVQSENGMIQLFKCTYPPKLKHPTLAVIGFFNPFGPGWPIAELQCRWAASIFSGKNKLPSESEMMDDIKLRMERNTQRYSPSEKMSIRVDFVQFMDEIATEIGVKPNVWSYLFTDFRLFLKLAFGPCLPYQMRLEGPHKWEGAREALMTSHERLHWPLQKENVRKKSVREALIEYIVNLIPSNVFF